MADVLVRRLVVELRDHGVLWRRVRFRVVRLLPVLIVVVVAPALFAVKVFRPLVFVCSAILSPVSLGPRVKTVEDALQRGPTGGRGNSSQAEGTLTY